MNAFRGMFYAIAFSSIIWLSMAAVVWWVFS
ncbi:membrane protein [Mycobacterium phage Aminay]|uniref:Membrane protein n=1 Tax=Mycobacterium phage Aminay TaxID=2250291 RepID=A0A345KV37_9CAUD|nr:membrane protein [Mycobacterium phage Aminay]AXH46889.1 membrane protein [Mycobacterium phage Aminay]